MIQSHKGWRHFLWISFLGLSCQQHVADEKRKFSFVDVTMTHLPDSVKLPNNSMDAKVADIDSDGDLDLIIAVEFDKNIILLNDGTGVFSDHSSLLPDKIPTADPAPYRYYPYHDSEDVVVEDFDKDGLLDIIYVTEDDEENEYYKQSSDGTFEDISYLLPGKGVSNAIATGDVDGDGWMDVIVGNNGQNFLWRNEKGSLLDETYDRLPLINDITQDVELGDVDGDGDLDLLVANELENWLLENDGNGKFDFFPKEVFTDSHSQETREGDLGDVNGDGLVDIFFANVNFFQKKNPAPRIMILESGEYVDRSKELLHISTDGGAVDCDFYDIDEDGDLDLLCGNGTLQGTTYGFTIASNDGHGVFSDVTLRYIEKHVKDLVIDVEAADFTGDGIVDIHLSCFRSSDRLLVGKSHK